MIDPPRYPATSEPSRWRVRVANARPEWAVAIEVLASRALDRGAIEDLLSRERAGGWADEAALKGGLRRVRAQTLAALIDRDLDGRATFAEVVAATTALAEVALGEAYRYLVVDEVVTDPGIDSLVPSTQHREAFGFGQFDGHRLVEAPAGSTVPSLMRSSSADRGMRTWRPTWMNRTRRSAMRRRGKRTVVPRNSGAWLTESSCSMIGPPVARDGEAPRLGASR
jgi:hypothetical protein